MKRWLLILLVVLIGGAMFSEARSQRAVKFFEMLRHTKGQFHGQPFTLLPWQNTIVRNVYGEVNERGLRQIKYVYIEIPKKNGKSELCAGAGLFHLFADGEKNGQVYGCAADREQASLVFDVAVDMIDQWPALRKRAQGKPNQRGQRHHDPAIPSQKRQQVLNQDHGPLVESVVSDSR